MCLKIFLRINNWHAPSALLFTYFWGLLSKITSMETMHVFDSYCYCWMLSSLMFQCLWPTNTSLVWCDQMRWKQCIYLTTIDIVCWFQFWRYSNAFDPQIFWDLPHPPWIWYNLIFNKTYLIFFWPTITAQISLIHLKGSFGSLNTLTSSVGGSLWVRSK